MAKAKIEEPTESQVIWMWAVRVGLVAVGTIAAGMAGCPAYNVWQKGMQGRAELAQADFNRQIKVREAEAARLSAVEYANAEIERARGVAEANRIIADGLKDNEAYLRYLWIDKVAGGAGHEVIYIPTEAGIPILEAGRVGRGAP